MGDSDGNDYDDDDDSDDDNHDDDDDGDDYTQLINILMMCI